MLLATLKVNTTNAYAELSAAPYTSGTINAAVVQFEFSADWEELGKTAVFVAGSNKYEVVLTGSNQCVVPHEVLASSGVELIVGVYGTNGDDENLIVIPTVWCSLGLIKPGTTIDDADNSETPTPSDVQQILGAVANVIGEAAVTVDGTTGTPSVQYDIVSGTQYKKLTLAFSGLKGAAGSQGAPGVPGVDGEDGEDGNGIESVVFDSSNNLVITETDGTVTTFGGIASAIAAAEAIADSKVDEPSAEGTDGQVLATNGSGGRYWKTVSGGGGGSSDFDELDNRPKYNGTTMSHSTDIPEVKTAAWDSKADGTHNHTVSDITDFPDVHGTFFCEYGTTTYEEISEAIEDGELCILNNSGTNYTYLGLDGSSRHSFATVTDSSLKYCTCTSEDVWASKSKGIEFTSNKVSSFNASPNNTRYPTEKLVKDSLDGKADVNHTHPGGNIPVGSADISVGSFSADATYSDYGYKALVTCSGVTVTASMTATVCFDAATINAGQMASFCECTASGLYVYANDANPTCSIDNIVFVTI